MLSPIKRNLTDGLHIVVKQFRYCSTVIKPLIQTKIKINNRKYEADNYTNVTPKISSYMGRNLYLQKDHPLSIVRQQIVNYFYKVFVNSKGNPQFSVFDNLNPVVSVQQNFDNLLIPKNHPSRAKSDCYYVNKLHLLRAHTTAHQVGPPFMG